MATAVSASWRSGLLTLLMLLSVPVRVTGRNQQPNIVFFLTDDQDQLLGGSLPPNAPGGATPIPVAQKHLSDGGATFTNTFIHTPICCPSRSETVTGRYLHNLKTPGQCKEGYSGMTDTGNHCCMHVDEGKVHNVSFATRLAEAGYAVGAFGKYLNTYDENNRKVPPGFSAWMVNGGGNYESPMFHVSGLTEFEPQIPKQGVWHADGQYTTAVVGNVSTAWIRHTVQTKPDIPFFAYIGPKAAHEPFTPAPWYANHWNQTWPQQAPRPPSFNCSADTRADKVKHVAAMEMLSTETAECIDQTFKDRWRTLMSVDDVINAVVSETQALGVFDNTYFIYSSDHGFQLGEMNLAMDKRNVYDFDIRIHLVASGPGIKPGSTLPQLNSNVDLTPTWWGLAGIDYSPDDVDGKSLVPLLIKPAQLSAEERNKIPMSVEAHLSRHSNTTWRDSIFIEYYFVGIDAKCQQKHPIEAADNNFIATRYVSHPQYGDLMYAEFESGTGGSTTFASPTHFELYEMHSDPWQLKNRYSEVNTSVQAQLHTTIQQWLHCKGSSCN